MSMAVFLTQAILISLSGALSPGPMTAVTIDRRFRRWAFGTCGALLIVFGAKFARDGIIMLSQ
jgi:threonine/homoserine/homoserine lactone efflux protein